MRRVVFFFSAVLFCCHVQAIAQIPQRPDSGGTPVRVTQLGPERFGMRSSYAVHSCLSSPALIVIRDRESWDKQWKQIWAGPACSGGKSFTMDASGHLVPTTIPAAPDIDFSREMIIVAAMGPTLRDAITIEEAYERSDRLEVVVRSISPGSCGSLYGSFEMGTQPVEIVRIVKTEHPIVFREIKAVMECKSGQPFTIRDEP